MRARIRVRAWARSRIEFLIGSAKFSIRPRLAAAAAAAAAASSIRNHTNRPLSIDRWDAERRHLRSRAD